MSKSIADKIHDTLTLQRFHDFYTNEFEAYISGEIEDDTDLTMEQVQAKIKKRIVELFNLEED